MGELTFEEFHSARMHEVQSFYTEEETTTYNNGDKTVTLKEWEVELTGNKLGHLVGFRIPGEEPIEFFAGNKALNGSWPKRRNEINLPSVKS